MRSRARDSSLWIISHRGAARYAPENTVAAFAQAVELGANAIEADVSATADEYLIMWHDESPLHPVSRVRRRTERSLYVAAPPRDGCVWRPVSELSLAEFETHTGYVLRRGRSGWRRYAWSSGRHNNGAWHETYAPAEMLEELFDWMCNEYRVGDIFLDLKFREAQMRPAIRLLWMIHDFLQWPRVRGRKIAFHLMSAESGIVHTLAEMVPKFNFGGAVRIYFDSWWPVPRVRKVIRRLGVHNIAVGLGIQSWPLFRLKVNRAIAARERGMVDHVIGWTINDPDRMRWLFTKARVDGIITDEPELLRQIAWEYGL